LLTKALVEEKYAIDLTQQLGEQVFEMPTGGCCNHASRRQLLYLPRKEQCIALGGFSKLRVLKFKISNYKIYRVF
jgi:photosystem I subunit 2